MRLAVFTFFIICAWAMSYWNVKLLEPAYAQEDPPDLVYVVASATYSVSYTLSRTAVPSPSATGILDPATLVDNDNSNMSVTAATQSNYTLLTHNLPYMKLTGLLGEPNDQATLGAKQTSSSNNSNAIHIGFGNAYARADDKTSDLMLWGTAGKCAEGALTDAADRTDTDDGEIKFGGPAGSHGGCLTSVKVFDRGDAVNSVGDGITFTFTKS